MNERTIQTAFSKKNKVDGCFELKLSKTGSIRFDAVKPHQIQALLAVSSDKGLSHKITDQPWLPNRPNSFQLKKPFDYFFLKNIPAYIVICFYVPRKKKKCYYISPQEWKELEIVFDKKSIREEELALSSEYTLEL